MATLDRPKLRALAPYRIDREGRPCVVFHDPLGLVDTSFPVPLDLFHFVVRHFDGRTEVREIQARVLRETGQLLTAETLQGLLTGLDQALILDGPSFEAFRKRYRDQRIRPAAHAGRSYAGTARALRAQLGHFFSGEQGAGLPDAPTPEAPRLRGILSPHIDFHRGGPTYTWAYRELVEQSDAEVFVILGVAHQPCGRRFVLTRKDFETPLGLARTERSYVDKLAALAGDHLFDDEPVHRTEHSIEFQVVFLQYLLEERRDVSIVPILVGSFHDLMEQGIDPIQDPEVRRFIAALRAAESASGRRVAYIGGVDLGHLGPEFGDPQRLDDATLAALRAFDAEILGRAVVDDPAGWFRAVGQVGNRWRICGLAATYTMLHAMGPARGRLLRYDQAVDADRSCCVSFASVAFDLPEPNESSADVKPPIPA